MWQLYVFGSLLASAVENVIDKSALVRLAQVDFYAATFWRPFLFSVVTALIGLTGLLGSLHFFFHPSILLLVPFGAISSLSYTYLMQRVELTSLGVVMYLTPFLFLLIDTQILHADLVSTEAMGVVLLVLGGIGFSLDSKTYRFKSELTWQVWALFVFGIVWSGSEAYLFKYLNTTYSVNGVSFLTSLWIGISGALFVLMLLQGRGRRLFDVSIRTYIRQIVLSKSSDALGSVLWAQALVYATVSQVSAFAAFDPLVLFLVVLFAQGILGLKLNEKLDRAYLGWKFSAVVLLVLGGYLVG